MSRTRMRVMGAALMLVVGSSVHARDLLVTGMSHSETSDDYYQTTIYGEYRSARRAMYWPWQESVEQGIDWGVYASRTKGNAKRAFDSARADVMLGGRAMPTLYAEAWAGVHQLEAGYTEVFHPWRTDVFIESIPTVTVQLHAADDFLHSESSLGAGIEDALFAKDRAVALGWRPHEKVRVKGEVGQRGISDGNYRHQASAAVMYGLSPSWPWIWAGVGAEQLSFDRTVPGYWSPTDYRSWGARFESSFPISARVSGLASASVSDVDDEGRRGRGTYGALGVDFQVAEDLVLRLAANRVNSRQVGEWWENRYTLTLGGGW